MDRTRQSPAPSKPSDQRYELLEQALSGHLPPDPSLEHMLDQPERTQR